MCVCHVSVGVSVHFMCVSMCTCVCLCVSMHLCVCACESVHLCMLCVDLMTAAPHMMTAAPHMMTAAPRMMTVWSLQCCVVPEEEWVDHRESKLKPALNVAT